MGWLPAYNTPPYVEFAYGLVRDDDGFMMGHVVKFRGDDLLRASIHDRILGEFTSLDSAKSAVEFGCYQDGKAIGEAIGIHLKGKYPSDETPLRLTRKHKP